MIQIGLSKSKNDHFIPNSELNLEFMNIQIHLLEGVDYFKFFCLVMHRWIEDVLDLSYSFSRQTKKMPLNFINEFLKIILFKTKEDTKKIIFATHEI